MATPLVNTAPSPVPTAPILGAVPGVAQASNALSPQGTMQAAPTQQTPSTQPVAAPAPQQQSGGANNVVQFIQQARAQKIPDEQIFSALHQQGLIPTNALVMPGQQPQQPQQQDTAQLQDTGSFLGNLGHSTGNFLKGLGSAAVNIFNPDMEKNTVANVAKVAGGLLETPVVLAHNLATGKNAGDEGAWQINNKPYENLVNTMAERYGSLDAVKKTAYQDPVGFLADAASLVSGAGEVASAAGKVSDISKLAEIGNTVTKVADAVNPVNTVTKPIEITSKLVKAGLENLGPSLEKSNLRMTPVQKANYATKVGDASDYISKHIDVGSPEARYEQAGVNVEQFENKIQNYLENDAAHVTIPKQDLITAADEIKTQFKNDRDALAINKQVDDFKATLESNYPNTEGVFNHDGSPVTPNIPVADINQLKRSTFQSAFNQAGTKVSDAVEYKLGDMLKNQIEDATKDVPVMGKYPIGKVNEAYGIALNAKKLLKAAMGRPQIGFVERLLLDAVGFGTGGPGGAIAAHLAQSYAPVTAVKAAIGKTARVAAKAVPMIKVPASVARVANTASRVNNYATQKVKKP